jgi:hypothetical protein
MGSRLTTEKRCYRCVAWGRGTCGRSWGCGRRGGKASQTGESKDFVVPDALAAITSSPCLDKGPKLSEPVMKTRRGCGNFSCSTIDVAKPKTVELSNMVFFIWSKLLTVWGCGMIAGICQGRRQTVDGLEVRMGPFLPSGTVTEVATGLMMKG